MRKKHTKKEDFYLEGPFSLKERLIKDYKKNVVDIAKNKKCFALCIDQTYNTSNKTSSFQIKSALDTALVIPFGPKHAVTQKPSLPNYRPFDLKIDCHSPEACHFNTLQSFLFPLLSLRVPARPFSHIIISSSYFFFFFPNSNQITFTFFFSTLEIFAQTTSKD